MRKIIAIAAAALGSLLWLLWYRRRHWKC